MAWRVPCAQGGHRESKKNRRVCPHPHLLSVHGLAITTPCRPQDVSPNVCEYAAVNTAAAGAGTHAPSVGLPPNMTSASYPRQTARSACLKLKHWRRTRRPPSLAGLACPRFYMPRALASPPHVVLTISMMPSGMKNTRMTITVAPTQCRADKFMTVRCSIRSVYFMSWLKSMLHRTRGMKKSPVLAGCIPCAKCRGAGEKRRTEFDVFSPFMQGLRNFQGPSWVPKVGWSTMVPVSIPVCP